VNTEIRSSRDRLCRLLVGCPHDLIADPNPADCPLHDKRREGLGERLAWARTVDPSVVDRVLGFHDLCLRKKRILDLDEYQLADL